MDLSGKTLPLDLFRYPSFIYFDHNAEQICFDLDQQNEAELLAFAKELEEYQLGNKPIRAMLIGGARDGSIVRIEFLEPAKRSSINKNVLRDGDPRKEGYEGRGGKDDYVEAKEVEVYPYNYDNKALYHMQGNICLGYKIRIFLDDNTDVTDKLNSRTAIQILLGSEAPTELKFTKKKREAAPEPIKFVDRFGVTIEPNDIVIFTDRSYSSDALIGADIEFGRIIKYFPAGGVLVRRMNGTERRIHKLDSGTLIKLDKDLPNRIMLEKLSTI